MGGRSMRITVVGAGYVGVCTAVALASTGHLVTLVDKDARRVEVLQEGGAPFYEPDLDEAVRRLVADERIRPTTVLSDVVPDAEMAFLCVGTPQGPDGAADLSYIAAASHELGAARRNAKEPFGIIVKSTVPPGTLDGVVAPAARAGHQGRPLPAPAPAPAAAPAPVSDAADPLWFASNPEFLREGSAVADALHPDRIVIGTRSGAGRKALRAMYAAVDAPLVEMDPLSAEFTKYAANCMLATRISLANELANLADTLGADWQNVVAGVRDDARIGGLFLGAGAGYGGSCFPKDVEALRHVARSVRMPTRILDATQEVNDGQPNRLVDMLVQELGALEGKRIALLGLSFKPHTDDVRCTRAQILWHALHEAGAEVVCHDPVAGATFQALVPDAQVADDPHSALDGADAAVLVTAWPEYKALSPRPFAALGHRLVVDGRRGLDADTLEAAGVRVRSIGRPATAEVTRCA